MTSNSSASSKGNTNTLAEAFGRNFQLTLNNEKNGDVDACNFILMDKYNKLIKYLTGLKHRYIIACKETNKKGFSHIHIYIQFDNKRKLSIKKVQGAHIEICRGSTNENIDYIKKDGNILLEHGNPKINGYNATINEIINTNNPNDLKNCNSNLINVINTIKNNSLMWDQGNFNDYKNINVSSKFNRICDINDRFKYAKKINNLWFGLSKNIIIDLSDYIKYDTELDEYSYDLDMSDILNDKNKPLNCKNQIFYPNDIKNIHFETNNYNAFRDFIRRYLSYVKKCNFVCDMNNKHYSDIFKYLHDEPDFELEDEINKMN